LCSHSGPLFSGPKKVGLNDRGLNYWARTSDTPISALLKIWPTISGFYALISRQMRSGVPKPEIFVSYRNTKLLGLLPLNFNGYSHRIRQNCTPKFDYRIPSRTRYLLDILKTKSYLLEKSHIAQFSRRMSEWEPISQGTAYPSAALKRTSNGWTKRTSFGGPYKYSPFMLYRNP
jgi:hypothetical protein